MGKKLILGICILAIAILAFGTLGTGAWWSIQTQTAGTVQAATFDVSAGSAQGTCSAANLAPGDPAVSCKIIIYNNSSIPVNVLWSGMAITTDEKGMADYLIITDFSDSNGTTHIADLGTGPFTLRQFAALVTGYFSDPNSTYDHTSVFVAAGEQAWVNVSYAFAAGAPNTTIGGAAGFTWTLTAQQLPVNPAP